MRLVALGLASSIVACWSSRPAVDPPPPPPPPPPAPAPSPAPPPPVEGGFAAPPSQHATPAVATAPAPAPASCGRDEVFEKMCGGMGIGGTGACGPRADSLASAGVQRMVVTAITGGMKRDPQLQHFLYDDAETQRYRTGIGRSGAGLPGPYCCYSRCTPLVVAASAPAPAVPPRHRLDETCIPPPASTAVPAAGERSCPAAVELRGVMRPFKGPVSSTSRRTWWWRDTGGKGCCYQTVVRDPPRNMGHCPTCKCAAAGTMIATPDGEVPIESLAPGDLVLSMHRGRLQAVPLRAVHREPVRDHVLVVATLASGRTVAMSPEHPTGDGRTFQDLAAGSSLGDARVVEVARVPYAGAFTYDLWPESDTATYVAEGALVGTTLTSLRSVSR